MGAVVAAGLTPGIVVASAAGQPNQGSNAGITAADVVAIAGTTYSFEELYAMQRGETVDTIEMHIVLEPLHGTLYGSIEVVRYKPSKEDRSNDKTIYHSVEQMSQFPGGETALMMYIKSQIHYPPQAAKEQIEGRVVLQFVVKKDGSVGKVKVIRSVAKDLDREAVRIIKTLPKFAPGRQNGKAVSVWYTLPVTFTLPEEDRD